MIHRRGLESRELKMIVRQSLLLRICIHQGLPLYGGTNASRHPNSSCLEMVRRWKGMDDGEFPLSRLLVDEAGSINQSTAARRKPGCLFYR